MRQARLKPDYQDTLRSARNKHFCATILQKTRNLSQRLLIPAASWGCFPFIRLSPSSVPYKPHLLATEAVKRETYIRHSV